LTGPGEGTCSSGGMPAFKRERIGAVLQLPKTADDKAVAGFVVHALALL
jgi:hypothetical protein